MKAFIFTAICLFYHTPYYMSLIFFPETCEAAFHLAKSVPPVLSYTQSITFLSAVFAGDAPYPLPATHKRLHAFRTVFQDVGIRRDPALLKTEDDR